MITPAFIVIDIETGDADESAIQEAIALWRAPSNIKKEETIEARRKEYAQKIREKSALLDASPILCIGLRAGNVGIVFSGMGKFDPPSLQGWTVIACNNEEEMLTAFGMWLDNYLGEPIIVGHNIKRFDLPKIRGRFISYRLNIPRLLRVSLEDEPKVTVIDTMGLFRSFTIKDDFYYSLEEICETFKIPNAKGTISGEEIPRLHREGRYQEIITYCCIDTDATAEAFRLMTGQ